MAVRSTRSRLSGVRGLAVSISASAINGECTAYTELTRRTDRAADCGPAHRSIRCGDSYREGGDVRRTLLILAGCITLSATLAQPAMATWSGSTVSNFGDSDSQTSRMLISPTGDAFVAWQSQGSDELYWAQKTPAGWQKTTVTGQNTFVACYTADDAHMGPSAALLPKGGAAIASACESFVGGSETKFSQLKGSTWTTTTVGYGPSSSTCSTSATDVDLVVSPGGKPVIFTTDE